MSIKYAFAAAAFAGALSATAAHAQVRTDFMTVQDMYTHCAANDDVCTAYISGVADTMQNNGFVLRALPANTPVTVKRTLASWAICGAEKVSYGAAAQAFKNWAQQNPQYLDKKDFYGAVAALSATWPCPAPH